MLIVDKYCEKRDVNLRIYQLLGLSAMFIAAKYQEIKTPKLKNVAATVKDFFKESEILSMESDILILLRF